MSCTIIIFHYESLAYLRACIRQIRKFKRDDIRQHIVIADQSGGDIRTTVWMEFSGSDDITVVRMDKYGSGYSVDYIMRHLSIDTKFICTIDVDTIPIHKNWLYVPIQLIEQAGVSFVGVHAELESAYVQMGTFFCMCQHFRVGYTSHYRRLAENIGFVKNDFRDKFSYVNTEWNTWSDDAVAAHWWEDQYGEHDKLTLAVTDYLGIAPLEGRYGRYTDDLVFHFGFSYNWKMVGSATVAMGRDFIAWMHRMDTEGLNDDMIAEMLARKIPLEAPIPRLYWDGKRKISYRLNDELNLLIEKLKTE
jgi:hypothetical protein